MPILAYGTAMGWISPHKALLMGESSPSLEPLTEEDVSWMASIMFIFAPIAVFIYGMAADKFGRKKALLCVSVPILVIIYYYSDNKIIWKHRTYIINTKGKFRCMTVRLCLLLFLVKIYNASVFAHKQKKTTSFYIDK